MNAEKDLFMSLDELCKEKPAENVDAKARQVMTKLYAIFELIDTLGIDCQNTIAVENKDYEDAIMMVSGVHAGVDCIVTRNPDHFTQSPVPVYSPADFVKKLLEEPCPES